MNYHRNLIHEVELIAHSCGVTEPRGLTRQHVRIVQNSSRSRPFSEIFPDETPIAFQGIPVETTEPNVSESK